MDMAGKTLGIEPQLDVPEQHHRGGEGEWRIDDRARQVERDCQRLLRINSMNREEDRECRDERGEQPEVEERDDMLPALRKHDDENVDIRMEPIAHAGHRAKKD